MTHSLFGERIETSFMSLFVERLLNDVRSVLNEMVCSND